MAKMGIGTGCVACTTAVDRMNDGGIRKVNATQRRESGLVGWANSKLSCRSFYFTIGYYQQVVVRHFPSVSLFDDRRDDRRRRWKKKKQRKKNEPVEFEIHEKDCCFRLLGEAFFGGSDQV